MNEQNEPLEYPKPHAKPQTGEEGRVLPGEEENAHEEDLINYLLKKDAD